MATNWNKPAAAYCRDCGVLFTAPLRDHNGYCSRHQALSTCALCQNPYSGHRCENPGCEASGNVPPEILARREREESEREERERTLRARARHWAQPLACVALAAFLSLPAFAAEPCKVNVNAATPAEIQLLARTGEVLAGRIVAGRPLDAEKLDAVKGVGPSWLAVNGPHVAFSGPTTCTEKIKAAPKVAAQAPKL